MNEDLQYCTSRKEHYVCRVDKSSEYEECHQCDCAFCVHIQVKTFKSSLKVFFLKSRTIFFQEKICEGWETHDNNNKEDSEPSVYNFGCRVNGKDLN